MVRHNNVIPNNHFKKKWQFYVKTWFNQAARKLRRRQGTHICKTFLLSSKKSSFSAICVVRASCSTRGEGEVSLPSPVCRRAAPSGARPDSEVQQQAAPGQGFHAGGAEGGLDAAAFSGQPWTGHAGKSRLYGVVRDILLRDAFGALCLAGGGHSCEDGTHHRHCCGPPPPQQVAGEPSGASVAMVTAAGHPGAGSGGSWEQPACTRGLTGAGVGTVASAAYGGTAGRCQAGRAECRCGTRYSVRVMTAVRVSVRLMACAGGPCGALCGCPDTSVPSSVSHVMHSHMRSVYGGLTGERAAPEGVPEQPGHLPPQR